MSKTSRRNKAERVLASKLGNYHACAGSSMGEKHHLFTKPGSKQIKG